MAKHHIVQDKYLTQWRKGQTQNQLHIYVIAENNFIERGPGWKGFWREDFNILLDEDGKSYLPEEITSVIDTKGIEAIKRIDPLKEVQLSGEDRNAISFYVALQYIRTPRHREETDKLVHLALQNLMRKDISSPDKVHVTKEEILKDPPANKREEEILKQVSLMSEEEIKKQIFETVQSDDHVAGLTKTGHSKNILKVDRLSEKLFEVQWCFLLAPKGTTFVTSDNPCFVISSSKFMNGLLSPQATVIFPLRPDICIYIKPGMKSKVEHFYKMNKTQVRDINQMILSHSSECVIAKDKIHLQYLIKNYDIKNHRKSRDITVTEFGNYTVFNAE